MPVVNLPTDTRWGDLGKGLGGLAGNILQGVEQQKTSSGVAAIMADQSVAEADKGVKVLKEHGDTGYQLYKQMLTSQTLQQQLKESAAKIGLTTIETQLKQKDLANKDPEFAARLAQTQANTQHIGAETNQINTLLPGQVAQQGATTAATTSATTARDTLLPGQVQEQTADIAGKQVSAIGGNLKNELASIQLDLLKKTIDPTEASSNVDALIERYAPTAAPEVKRIAKGAFEQEKDPLKKGDALVKVLGQHEQAAARANIPADAPADIRKQTVQSSEAATSMEKFVDAFRSGGAQKIGALGGSWVKALAEKYGFPTGDAEFNTMFNSSIQSAASIATQGGGFYSNGRFQLGKDVTPGINETPLHAAVAMDEVVDRQLAALTTQKANLAGKSAQGGLDQQIAKWNNIKEKMGFHAFLTQPPEGTDPKSFMPKTVVLFGGNEVDPKTFKPLVEGDKTIKFKSTGGSEVPIPGKAIIDDAVKRHMSPAQRMAEIKAFYETH